MPCNQYVKLLSGARNLNFREITFIPLYRAHQLLTTPSMDIATISLILFPSISGQARDFNEVLDCVQFAFTSNRSGSSAAQSANDLMYLRIVEGGALFTASLHHL